MKEISERDQDASKSEQTEAGEKIRAESLSPRYQTIGSRAELSGTQKEAQPGSEIGPADPNQEISVTVMVKSKASDKEIDDTLKAVINQKRAPLTDAEFEQRFSSDPGSVKRILEFANKYGLSTEKVDTRAGHIVLKGNVAELNKAFGVSIANYRTDSNSIGSDYKGRISVPVNVADDVMGVFGLDSVAQSKTHIRLRPAGLQPRSDDGYMPDEVANYYHFPKESMGAGQSVGIIELGGGLDVNDNAQYYKEHGLKLPSIDLLGVDGASNKPGANADAEVALDSQIVGVVAPDAHQQIIFGPNTKRGFVDAITRAIFPEEGEMQNTAISISWGSNESLWSQADLANMNMAFKKAALKGITVFAAAGDNGASDGSFPKHYTTDYPSSDPFVTGCGGTELYINSDHEVTWNDGSDRAGATGGGISNVFEAPEFQNGIKLPKNINPNGKEHGRGVPDVAGDAAWATGYRIRLGGSEYVAGGTSAVAPLYAGLMMRINGALGSPVGYLNPFLYKNADKGIFRDILLGDNNGYKTGPGWDATTGWGTIVGDKMQEVLKKQRQI